MKGCLKSIARLLTVCAASFSALALSGCGDRHCCDNNFFGVFGFGGAEIRLLNGSPDTGAVDIAFQEHIFTTDRSFGAVQFHQAATGLGTASIDAGSPQLPAPRRLRSGQLIVITGVISL